MSVTGLHWQVYDPNDEEDMGRVVKEISERSVDSGVNLVYTCPDWLVNYLVVTIETKSTKLPWQTIN